MTGLTVISNMESGDGTEGVDDQDPLKLDESPQKQGGNQSRKARDPQRSFRGFQARIISHIIC